MKVKVVYKSGSELEYNEVAVMDDYEAGWAILADGHTTGNRTDEKGYARNHYGFKEYSHIAIRWCDIERIEVMP